MWGREVSKGSELPTQEDGNPQGEEEGKRGRVSILRRIYTRRLTGVPPPPLPPNNPGGWALLLGLREVGRLPRQSRDMVGKGAGPRPRPFQSPFCVVGNFLKSGACRSWGGGESVPPGPGSHWLDSPEGHRLPYLAPRAMAWHPAPLGRHREARRKARAWGLGSSGSWDQAQLHSRPRDGGEALPGWRFGTPTGTFYCPTGPARLSEGTASRPVSPMHGLGGWGSNSRVLCTPTDPLRAPVDLEAARGHTSPVAADSPFLPPAVTMLQLPSGPKNDHKPGGLQPQKSLPSQLCRLEVSQGAGSALLPLRALEGILLCLFRLPVVIGSPWLVATSL